MSRRVMADGEIVSVSLRDMVPSVLFAGRGIPPSQLTERAVTLRYQARIDRPIVAARSCEELGPDWDRCASASRKEWGKTPPERGFLRGERPDSNRRPLGPQPGGTGAAHVPSRIPERLGASELLLVSLKLDPRLDPGSLEGPSDQVALAAIIGGKSAYPSRVAKSPHPTHSCGVRIGNGGRLILR